MSGNYRIWPSTFALAATFLLPGLAHGQFTVDKIVNPSTNNGIILPIRLSADCKSVIGNLTGYYTDPYTHRIFVWTKADGTQYRYAFESEAYDCSSNLSTIVGRYMTTDSHARFLDKTGSFAQLPMNFDTLGLSGDGKTVFGYDESSKKGVLWHSQSDYSYFPTVAPFDWFVPKWSNADGSVIVGTSYTSATQQNARPTRWSAGSGTQLLPLSPGYEIGVVTTASNNGDTVYGWQSDAEKVHPVAYFRWQKGVGTQMMPAFENIPGIVQSSSDGQVLFCGGSIWTQQSGWMYLSSYMAANGHPPIQAYSQIRDVSDDGRTIVCMDNFDYYVLHIDLPPVMNSLTMPTSSSAGITLHGSLQFDRSISTPQSVKLSTDHPELATLPDNFILPAGQTNVSFPMETVGVSKQSTFQVTAQYGTVVKTSKVTLAPAVLKSVSLKSYNIVGGNRVDGTVLLSGKTPDSGGTAKLSSDNAAVSYAASNISIAAQTTSAPFTLIAHPVLAATNVTISGTYNGKTLTNTVMILPTSLSSLKAPSYVKGGSSLTLNVLLNGQAPSTGIKVSLTSSAPALAAVPSSVTIPYGGTRFNVTVATKPVVQNTAVTFTGVYNNRTVSYRVLLTP